MVELAAAAVEQYTRGRLDAGDAETDRLLGAALAAARRWCGWHVTPVKEDDEVTIDGRGGRMLRLPTLQLGTLTSVTEDDVELDLADLRWSALGMVQKKSGAWWSCNFGAIKVKMTHGFDTAPDFDAAVLSLIDRESSAPSGGRMRAVGPFQYELDPIGSGVFTAAEQAALEQFRLERPA